jgi:3'-phosphoadenosine 5'-phosphosulfate sulfotransferase (PAPS reductase)/FAD synthetase
MATSLQLPTDVEEWPAERVVEWLLERFPGNVALACSFQKEETVLLDMLFALEPNARVFGIDTHYLFQETYAHWREVEQRYGITIEKFEGCWAYIRERGLPYNALHDQGYDSIGDTHSTQPGRGREGRWAGMDKTECGIHTVASEEVKELLS